MVGMFLIPSAAMADTTFRGDTLQPAGGAGPQRSVVRVPALTIAAHADPARVGDQLRMPRLLLGGTVGVARLEPAFESGKPLKDPFVSRRPLRFEGAGQGLRIDPGSTSSAIVVDGVPLSGPITVEAAALDAGVVIEIAERVVVVLHRASPGRSGGEGLPGAALLGVSDGILDVRAEIARVAADAVPLLVLGESGTGKELVARALHEAGPRAARPFVSVNMGAIPPTTAASELFGHARGAFTGAAEAHRGFFGRAHTGTLFMDEVGELPGAVQPLLLRALETGEIQGVGARGPVRVNVRLVAATDADLDAAVAEGAFRTALLHRIAGYEIALPPLRARKEDVGLLLHRFLASQLPAGTLAGRDAKEPLWLPTGLVARLCRYDWPGNVRQLKNVATRLAISSRGEPTAVVNASVERLIPESSRPPEPAPKRASPTDLDSIDDERLLAALEDNDYRVAATARSLGISKNSLYRLMDACPRLTKAADLTAEDIERAADELGGDLTLMARALKVSRRGLQLRMRDCPGC